MPSLLDMVGIKADAPKEVDVLAGGEAGAGASSCTSSGTSSLLLELLDFSCFFSFFSFLDSLRLRLWRSEEGLP